MSGSQVDTRKTSRLHRWLGVGPQLPKQIFCLRGRTIYAKAVNYLFASKGCRPNNTVCRSHSLRQALNVSQKEMKGLWDGFLPLRADEPGFHEGAGVSEMGPWSWSQRSCPQTRGLRQRAPSRHDLDRRRLASFGQQPPRHERRRMRSSGSCVEWRSLPPRARSSRSAEYDC